MAVKGISRSGDADVVEPGVYDIALVAGAHRIRVSTQPSGTPGRRSCYYEEISIDVESGQAIERSMKLQKLLENW